MLGHWRAVSPYHCAWGVWTGSGAGYPGAGWAQAQVGISDLQLSDQAWSGTRFNSPTSPPGIAFAAVPEPSCVLAVILGLFVFVLRRSKFQSGSAEVATNVLPRWFVPLVSTI